MFALKILSKTRFVSFNLKQLLPKQLIKVSAVPFSKKVHDSEFEFFNNYLQSPTESVKVSGNIKIAFEFNESFSDKTVEELINLLQSFNNHCASSESCTSSEQLDDLIHRLIEELPELNDDQLIQILIALQRFPRENEFTKNFNDLWTELDGICFERGRHWSQLTLLKMCSLWFKLNVHSKFIEGALTKLRRGVFKLPKEIFLGTIFYLTVCRRDLPLTLLEVRFSEMFDELTNNEIGIFCLSLYKSECWIKNVEIVDKLYDRTIADIDTIEEVTLQYFLKQIRLSSEPRHADKMKILCNVLLPRIDSYCLKTCLHIGLLGTNSQYCHQELVESVVTRFNKDIKQAIVKDFPELSFILGHFNFKTESGVEKELMAKIVDELKLRVDEVVKVPSCLATTMNNLTFCGLYDIDIIKFVLSEKFIRFAYGKQRFNIGNEILSLDSFTRINLKDSYEGPQVSTTIKTCIMKGQFHTAPDREKKLKVSEKVLLDIKDLMEKRYGQNMLVNVLPHFKRPDVVYCFDETGKSVMDEIIDCFPPVFSGEILSKEYLLSKKEEFAKNSQRFEMVAVILGYSNFYLRETNQPVGELRMKIEQLEKIGYKPVVIKWEDWFSSRYQQRKKLVDDEIQKVLGLKRN